MAPDLNSNNRCSIAHVPSSNNYKASMKCTPSVHPNEIPGYNNHQSTNNNSNKNKCLDCCSVHERSNRTKSSNQKNLKSTINEFGNTNQSIKPFYNRTDRYSERSNEKCVDKYGDKYEKCFNEKYNNDRYINDRYTEKFIDKYSDKYVDRYYTDKHFDKHLDKHLDKYEKYPEKCPEKYPNNYHHDKYLDRINDKYSDKCNEKCNGKCNEKLIDKNNDKPIDKSIDKPIDKTNQELTSTDKQLMDNKQSTELTPYDKVMLNLKKRAKQRIERKETSNPFVGMYRLRKEIGNGNFSQVHIGSHCLTKGILIFFFLII